MNLEITYTHRQKLVGPYFNPVGPLTSTVKDGLN